MILFFWGVGEFEDMHGNSHPINLDDTDEKEIKVVDSKGKLKVQTNSEMFKLIFIGRIGVQESKPAYKYCQTKLVWQKGIGTSHLNIH